MHRLSKLIIGWKGLECRYKGIHNSFTKTNRRDPERVHKFASKVMIGASYTTHKYGLKYFKIETLDKSRKHLYNLVTRYVSYKEDPPQDGGIDKSIKNLSECEIY